MDKTSCSPIPKREITCASTSGLISFSSPSSTLFICDLCGTSFLTRDLLKIHIDLQHVNVGKTFVFESKTKHQKKPKREVRIKEEKERKRPPETKAVNSQSFPPAHQKIIKMLRRYLNSVSFAVGRKSFCKLCAFTTKYLEDLNNHIMSKHKNIASPFDWANEVLRFLPWKLIYNCEKGNVGCPSVKKEDSHLNDHSPTRAVTPEKQQKYYSSKSQDFQNSADYYVSDSESTWDQRIENNNDLGIRITEVRSLSQPIVISFVNPGSKNNNEFQCVNDEKVNEFGNNFPDKSYSAIVQRWNQNQSGPRIKNCAVVCETLGSLRVPKNHDAPYPELKQKSLGKESFKKLGKCDASRQSVKQKSSNGKGYSSKKEKKKMEGNGGPKVTCNRCMIPVFKRYWKKHNENWHGMRRFKCKLCLKRFLRKKNWIPPVDANASEVDNCCKQCFEEVKKANKKKNANMLKRSQS